MSNKLTNSPLNVQDIEQFTKHEQSKEMNNEPVAWWHFETYDIIWNDVWEELLEGKDDWYPLYTAEQFHPEKTDKKVISVVALEERLNWSRHHGSGESYIEGFQDGAEWAEQQVFNPAKKEDELTIPENSQDWKGMDGATAWHLIWRHADGWSDTRMMMEEWCNANSHPAKTLTGAVGSLSDEEIDYEFDEFVWTGSRRADFELIVRQVERAILIKANEK